jgi:hypothetical protein
MKCRRLVECLPNKPGVLISCPSTNKNKNYKNNEVLKSSFYHKHNYMKTQKNLKENHEDHIKLTKKINANSQKWTYS